MYQKKLFLSHAALSLFWVLSYFSSVSYGQDWENNYGGTSKDYGESVQQTSDGGYIIVGYTTSFASGDVGDEDVYLIKTDSGGTEQWSNTFGGAKDDRGMSVQQTADGGYILAGYTRSFGAGGSDMYLIKTDSEGKELWSNTFGSTGTDLGFSVQQTSDGGYIIAGELYVFSEGYIDVYLVKTDSDGNLVWASTFGGDYTDRGYSVQQTGDGGYIVVGSQNTGLSDYDVFLIKTNNTGDKEWSRTLSEGVVGHSVQQTADGGYIISGGTTSGDDTAVMCLIKTDTSGTVEWSRSYSGDYGYSVKQTTDGGYIIAGQTWNDTNKSNDACLIKTYSDGNEDWGRTFGGSGSDYGKSVQQTADGGFIMAGATSVPPVQVYLVYYKPAVTDVKVMPMPGMPLLLLGE